MDKNMIKIDDFVRQRLSGGEEKERAGAWLQMRDLLDDKMPVRPTAGGYNWRRMLTAATGLLLVASLTVGGYKMYKSFHPDNESLRAGNVAASYKMPKGNISIVSAESRPYHNNHTENDKANSSDIHADKQAGTPQNSVAGVNKPAERRSNAATENLHIHTTHSTVSNKKTTAPNNNQAQNSPAKTGKSTPEMTTYNSEIPHSGTHPKTTAIATTYTHDNNSSGDILTENNKGNLYNVTTSAVSGTQPPVDRKTIPANNTESAAAPQPASSFTAPAAAKERAVIQPTTIAAKEAPVTMDSMPKIAITERVKVDPIRRTVTSLKDTTSVSKMAIEKPVAAENVTASALQPASKPVQAHGTGIAKTENKTSAASKISSQVSGMLSAERLKEMLAETQFRLGQMKLYSGITGGINNYMYGPNSMMGIQIGVRMTAAFDEKWSMFLEPKYMQRFNKNYVVKDNYWQVGEITGNEYKAKEIEHFFKFSALHTIEMPVALRYQLFKQLHIFAGGNLAYNFKINAEEIKQIPEEEGTYTGNSFGLPYQPSVHLDHFGSRFSAGYLLGLSYQVSPAFDIDARMTRNFWDNAAGSGPRKISDQLLYRPSLQLSIGYKFLQRNKIPPAK